MSRPPPPKPTAQFNIRLPVDVIKLVRMRAALDGRSPAAVVAAAIRKDLTFTRALNLFREAARQAEQIRQAKIDP